MTDAKKIEELAELAEAVARARGRSARKGAPSFVIWGSYALLASLISGLSGFYLAWFLLVPVAGFLDAGRLSGRWGRAAAVFGLGLLASVGLAFLHPVLGGVALGLTIGFGYGFGLPKSEAVSPVLRLVGGLWFFNIMAAVSLISAFGLWASSRQLLVWAAAVGAATGVIGFGTRSAAYITGGALILAMVLAAGLTPFGIPAWAFGAAFGAVLTVMGAYEHWRLSRA